MKTPTAPVAEPYTAPTERLANGKKYDPPTEQVTLKYLPDRVSPNHLTLVSTGKNLAGPLQYFTNVVSSMGVDIQLATGTPLGDRYTISLCCYSDDPAKLDAVEEYLRHEENRVIRGKRVVPVQTNWLRILSPNMLPVMDPVLQVLVGYDITLSGVAGTTHPAVRAHALGYPYAGDDGQIAAIKIKIGVPAHRVAQLDEIREKIAALNEKWVVAMTDAPERDLAPAWPGESAADYKAAGDFKYARTGS
jgi:hypothetical protein